MARSWLDEMTGQVDWKSADDFSCKNVVSREVVGGFVLRVRDGCLSTGT